MKSILFVKTQLWFIILLFHCAHGALKNLFFLQRGAYTTAGSQSSASFQMFVNKNGADPSTVILIYKYAM